MKHTFFERRLTFSWHNWMFALVAMWSIYLCSVYATADYPPSAPLNVVPAHAIPARVPVVTVFIHGIKTDERQGNYYHTHHYFVEGPWYNVIMPDKISKLQRTSWMPHHWYGYLSQLRKGSLGQEEEVKLVVQELQKVRAQYPNHAIVLYGVSRGAALALNTVAYMQQHNPEALHTVAALVLEAPFAHVNDTIAKSTFRMWNPPMNIKQKIFNWYYFPHHQINGVQPITSIAHVPTAMPLFFACTINDDMVPVESTQRLYRTVQGQRSASDASVVLCTVKTGDHARMFCEEYRQQLIGFYRAVGLAL